jgi:hypothetical protein
MQQTQQQKDLNFDYKYGFSMPDTSVFKTERGINPQIVYQISKIKNEPECGGRLGKPADIVKYLNQAKKMPIARQRSRKSS